MYKIERAPYGLHLTLTGTMSFEEVERWEREVAAALSQLPRTFGVFVDMRNLAPLSTDAQGALKQGQLFARQQGMQRSAVIVDSTEIARQFQRIARDTGIYEYERYIDATVEKNWEQMAIDWIVEGIDPDVGLRASSADRAR